MSYSPSRNEPVCDEVPAAQKESLDEGPLQTESCDEVSAQTTSCDDVPTQTASCDDEVPTQTTSCDDEVPTKTTSCDDEVPAQMTPCDKVAVQTKSDTENTNIAKCEIVIDGPGPKDSCAVLTTGVVAPVEKVAEPEAHSNVNTEDAGESLCGIVADSTLKETDKKDDKLSLEEILANKLETISIYFKLVMHPKNHSMLLKESSVIGFLLLCLGDEIAEVVERSFEVIRILSKCQENLAVLESLEYTMDALRCVLSNGQVKASVRREAKKLIAALKSLSSKKHPPLSELSESKRNVMVSKSTDASCGTTSTTAADCKDSGKKSADLNTTMSTLKRKNKGKETILFLDNGVLQQKSERTKVTQALICVPGIISVTYDLKNNFCLVRGKRTVAPEVFGRAVATQGIGEVYLVRKNEKSEEVKIPITCDGTENMTCALPPYPEELENENIDDSGAVARTDQVPSDDKSFFKSATSFIKRSFYW